ncbi:hypothetical protein RB195_009094 [Necator americanus]|uniref:Uncharacterized protein n=1 Tax=Necator americanus TaxID=51031 RepID=A0ABR1CTG1_NECAM
MSSFSLASWSESPISIVFPKLMQINQVRVNQLKQINKKKLRFQHAKIQGQSNMDNTGQVACQIAPRKSNR